MIEKKREGAYLNNFIVLVIRDVTNDIIVLMHVSLDLFMLSNLKNQLSFFVFVFFFFL